MLIFSFAAYDCRDKQNKDKIDPKHDEEQGERSLPGRRYSCYFQNFLDDTLYEELFDEISV